jgi:hypothetical protein
VGEDLAPEQRDRADGVGPEPLQDHRAARVAVIGDLLGQRAAGGLAVLGQRYPDAGREVERRQVGGRRRPPSSMKGRTAK